jgi:hypothetical protein
MSPVRIAAGVIAGLVVTVTGCTNPGGNAPTATPAAARVTPDVLPPEVSSVFRRDHPNAGITGVTQSSAETGQPLYRVTFIDNGQAGAATYFHNGQRLPQPGLNTNETPVSGSSGRPAPAGTVTPDTTVR